MGDPDHARRDQQLRPSPEILRGDPIDVFMLTLGKGIGREMCSVALAVTQPQPSCSGTEQ